MHSPNYYLKNIYETAKHPNFYTKDECIWLKFSGLLCEILIQVILFCNPTFFALPDSLPDGHQCSLYQPQQVSL